MIKILILFFAVFIISCSHKFEDPIDIVLNYANVYEIDVTRGVYRVFLENDSIVEVHFKLSNAERDIITHKYYTLNLNSLPENVDYTKSCLLTQSGLVQLKIRSKKILQTIKLDTNCKSSASSEIVRLIKFIEFVDGIVRKKPEVIKAPHSNIFLVD